MAGPSGREGKRAAHPDGAGVAAEDVPQPLPLLVGQDLFEVERRAGVQSTAAAARAARARKEASYREWSGRRVEARLRRGGAPHIRPQARRRRPVAAPPALRDALRPGLGPRRAHWRAPGRLPANLRRHPHRRRRQVPRHLLPLRRLERAEDVDARAVRLALALGAGGPRLRVSGGAGRTRGEGQRAVVRGAAPGASRVISLSAPPRRGG